MTRARLRKPCFLFIAITLGLAACGEPPPPLDHSGPVAGWSHYGGDPGATRYSPLTQITAANVEHLEVAWTHRTGDVTPKDEKAKTSHQVTPILDDGALFYCSPMNRVFALDAETGEELWAFDPKVVHGRWSRRCRGVSLWRDPTATSGEACARRIFTGTMDGRLIAVDAATGALCAGFGDGGEVDLRRGLGAHPAHDWEPTSVPTVIGDVVAVGASVIDGAKVNPPGGVIRGFDTRTGTLRWAFDPVPPDWPTLPPAEDGPQYHRATPNAWGVFSTDPTRDLLFLPMGNPSPDFYRGPGVREDLDYYGSSVVALRGQTGEVVWHYQTVHHDLWDYDVAATPALIEVEVEGRRVAAVAQATKMGFLFLLDRETGIPLHPVEERPVPTGGPLGDWLSPTQPFPTHPPPLQPTHLGPDDAWGLTPIDRAACRRTFEALRTDGIYTPPSLEGNLLSPGVAGGINWGGLAFDPERQVAVMNSNRIANSQQLIPRAEAPSRKDRPKHVSLFRQIGTPYLLVQRVPLSPLGIPCTKPPWGTLQGVDLARGEVIWEIPFGTTRGRAPWPFWFAFGMPSMGGPTVTASGLVFIGAAMDGYLRAYDTMTGEELWRTHLPAGGQAGPMTYRLRPDGRQFVVIAAGGHSTLDTERGDRLMAFALPE
ncbi:MAG: pyrroloquinoline quinone-dependent dehydrogenase [Deltaproteobacteria bacterium]|nr:pyrroloquinoline quinone-dependent dehydrogenase [Deltaproteobacteria bacterium]MBW2446396.1 pyrroloquinoline quinone-dependent dehydrogenase [Deltaproteobacteria bacterium]